MYRKIRHRRGNTTTQQDKFNVTQMGTICKGNDAVVNVPLHNADIWQVCVILNTLMWEMYNIYTCGSWTPHVGLIM